jgi:AcrR family transcriptional regulator
MSQSDPTSIPTGLLPSRATADGTLRRLQEAALVLFSERGFHGVSVREIAAAVGVRASSLYSHLTSKEQLLADLMLMGHEEQRDGLRRALLDAGIEPADQIRALARSHVAFHANYSLLARVSNRELAALAPASRERVLAVRNDAVQIMSDVVERGHRLGVFDAPEPWLAVAAVAAMGLRVAEWWDAQDHNFTVEQVAERYAQFAVRLLTPAPPTRRR